MTTPASVAAGAAPRPTWAVRGAMALWASIVVSLLGGSSAPTAVYAVYQREWGFTAITTTVVFAVYGIAVLGGLLILGRLSDHVGRRPVALTALGAQIVSMVVFALAGDVAALIVARVVQGPATGAAVAAVGAALLDLDRVRGSVANSMAPGLGTGVGGLTSGLAVAFLPAPTHLVYLVFAVVFLVQAVAVALVGETSTPVPGARAGLRPEITVPAVARPRLATAAPVVFAVWAMAGFYGSLGPQLTATLIGRPSPLWGGLSLLLLAGTAATSVLVTRRLVARRVLLLGIAATTAGLAIVIAAIGVGSLPLFVAGTVVAGVGFGSGFQGGIRLVVPPVAPHERAGTVALLYLVSYTGMSLPAVVAGVLVVELAGSTGVRGVAAGFAGAVVLLCLVALATLARSVRFPTTEEHP